MKFRFFLNCGRYIIYIIIYICCYLRNIDNNDVFIVFIKFDYYVGSELYVV